MKKKRLPSWIKLYFVLGFVCGMAGVFIWQSETGGAFPGIFVPTLLYGVPAGLAAGVILVAAMSSYHIRLWKD